MVWTDYITGQHLFVGGVEQSPRRSAWNFIGVSVAFNASTKMWDITVTGGGSQHVIKSNGGAGLAARPDLNFVAPLAAADNGGSNRTDVSLSGVVPVAKGGTGLAALGSALQSIRVKSDGSALEYYTPTGGSGGGGGGAGFPFTLSATTTDSDPGSGTLRLSSATYSAVTFLYVDIQEYGGTDISDWLDQFDDFIGSIKGVVRLQSKSDATKWVEYYVSGVTSVSGYRKIAVTYKDGPGGLLTTAGDTSLSFDALGISPNLGNAALFNAKTISYPGEVTSGGAVLDFTTGQAQKRALAADTTFSFVWPAGWTAGVVHLQQDGTGGWEASWPGAVNWGEGAPPILDTAPNSHTFVQLMSPDGGTTVFGWVDKVTIPTTFPARGQENVAVDAWPTTQTQGTIATAATVNVDVPVVAGKQYQITASVWVDDGAGGSNIFAKALVVRAHQTSGAAAIVTTSVVDDTATANWAFTGTSNGTDIRFSLVNTSGSTRSYNILISKIVADKP